MTVVVSRLKKLYIFDLDGTAIKSEVDALPSEALIEVINNNRENAFFSVATGRSWLHAEKTVKALKLTHPCIISGGTQIICPETKEIIWSKGIATESINNILDVASRFGKEVAYVDGLFTSEQQPVSEVDNLYSANTMYMLGIRKNELEDITSQINSHAETRAIATHSWSGAEIIDLHITSKFATKGNAVAALLKAMHISYDQTTAIGDGLNDIDLLDAVKIRVAMGNAVDELKRYANHVVETINEDGLAKFFKKEFSTYE